MATVNIARGFREAKQPLPFLAVYSVLFIHNYIVDSGPILSWILNEVRALWCPDPWGNFPDGDGLAIKLKSEMIQAVLICKI